MKRLIGLLIAIPLTVTLAAYMSQESQSNGATPVTILSAPGATTSRTAFENSIKVANGGSSAITCTVQKALTATTNVLEVDIILGAGETWYNEWRTTLDNNQQSLEIVADAAASTNLYISVSYRDETQ